MSVRKLATFDQLCESIVDGWKSGTKPLVEDVLNQLPDATDDELLELVRAEIRGRLSSKNPDTKTDWTHRFPQLSDRIDSLLAVQPTAFIQQEKVFRVENPVQNAKRGQPINVDGYEILSELGRGGMGVVYKARQNRLNRIVALKMVLTGHYASDEELTRFHREAEAVASVSHPNIVQVYEIGEHEGNPYLALEFVGGGTLGARLKKGILDERVAASLAVGIARGAHVAHQHHIVHRDLKPANIMLQDSDATQVGSRVMSTEVATSLFPKITDFGIAKRLDMHSDLTGTGIAAGSPQYMSPEQVMAKKESPVGPPSDVWAIGIILCEMLTNQTPFDCISPVDVFRRVTSDSPVMPQKLYAGVSPDLMTIILKCLEKNPLNRYGSAALLADDLERFLTGQSILARRIGPFEQLSRWTRRNSIVAGLLFGIMALLVAGTTAATILAIKANNYSAQADINARQFEAEKEIADWNAKQFEEKKVIAEKNAILAQEEAERARRAETSANEAREVQELLRKEAARQERIRARELYAASISSGHSDYLNGHTANALNMLRKYQPVMSAGSTVGNADGGKDIGPDERGFEWYYLNSLVHSVDYSLELPSETNFAGAHPNGTDWFIGTENGVIIWGRKGDFREVHNYTSRVLSGAIAPDRLTLALGTAEPIVATYNLASRQIIRKFEYLPEWTRRKATPLQLVFSPDGKSLAAALGTPQAHDTNGLVVVWDTETGKIRHQLAEETSSVKCVRFLNDRELVSCGMNVHAMFWNLETGKPTKKIALSGPAVGMAINRQQEYMAIGMPTGTIELLDIRTGKSVRLMTGHKDWITAIDFSPDGARLVTAAREGIVRVWSVPRGTEIETINAHDGIIVSLAYDRKGDFLLTTGSDRQARLWNSDMEHLIQPDFSQRSKNRFSSTTLTFDKFPREMFPLPDGQHVLVCSNDGALVVLNARENRVVSVRPIPQLSNKPYGYALSPDAKRLLVSTREASGHGVVKAYALDKILLPEFSVVPLPDLCKTSGYGMAFRPDGAEFAASHATPEYTTVSFYDPAKGTLLNEWRFKRSGPDLLKYQPKHDRIGGSTMTEFFLWNRDGKEHFHIRCGNSNILDFDFSPDGTTFVTAHYDASLKLWDAHTGKLLRHFEGHTQSIPSVRFDSTGRRIASGSWDLTMRVWDVATGQQMLVLDDQDRPSVRGLFVDRDLALISVNNMGQASVWNAWIGKQLADAKTLSDGCEIAELNATQEGKTVKFSCKLVNRTNRSLPIPRDLPLRRVSPFVYINVESPDPKTPPFLLGVSDSFFGGRPVTFAFFHDLAELKPGQSLTAELYLIDTSILKPGRHRATATQGRPGFPVKPQTAEAFFEFVPAKAVPKVRKDD
jgi:eukaryotic-like serine/threonine-protein kinase